MYLLKCVYIVGNGPEMIVLYMYLIYLYSSRARVNAAIIVQTENRYVCPNIALRSLSPFLRHSTLPTLLPPQCANRKSNLLFPLSVVFSI